MFEVGKKVLGLRRVSPSRENDLAKRIMRKVTGPALRSMVLWIAAIFTAGSLTLADRFSFRSAVANERPNIVFLLADDLGYGDLPCYGRNDLSTPAIDRLAKEGVRFTQAYANGPECTPTRAAFLTGRYQQRIGGLECAIGTGDVGRYDDAIRLALAGELGLPADEVTVPSLLQDAGYDTILFGKWHLGYALKFSPRRHGFNLSRYCLGGGMDYFYYTDTLGIYNLYENGEPLRAKGYFTDLIADWAESYLAKAGERPFFLYLAFTAPHSPYQGPHDNVGHPLPGDSPLWDQSQGVRDVYCAMIERMDAAIGRLLEALDRRNLTNNTVVIFASDNGGTRSGSNAPLSGFKGSTQEGGIRVPTIVRWPGRIPAGAISDQVCITMDFSASIIRLSGARLPPGRTLDGVDIIALLESGAPPLPRTLFWRARRGNSTWWAVRDGDTKYWRRRIGDKVEEHLFDLASDLSESHDLLGSRPSRATELRLMLQQWEEQVKPQR
ncbi:MAG: sulfatase-like hydrolase/transferase [Thermogutta sp.]